tara:strand:- start:4090 stop:4308 length:219 start_codon:yes stop_codon:yes gene_type:complete
MCLPSRSPRTPPPDPIVEQEREAAKAEEQVKKAEMRQDALEETVQRKRKGTGRRSLLSGSGGGIGFYNRYDS